MAQWNIPWVGISAFIVDTNDATGFSVQPIRNKLGVRGSATGEIHFDNVKVPADNLLGGEGNGARVLMSGLNIERLIGTAAAIGYMQAAVGKAKSVVSFNSDKIVDKNKFEIF